MSEHWIHTKTWPPETASWDELRAALNTDLQRETFDGILFLVAKNGAYPNLKELAIHLNLTDSKVRCRIESLDGWVIRRTPYFERIDTTKWPMVVVQSPRLRSDWDRQQRRMVNVNRQKLYGRRYFAKKRAERLALKGVYKNDDIRDMLFMQRGRCWWCQCELDGKFHVDHRIPLARGGSNNPENLCLSCPTCNIKKGDKMPWEFCGRLL